MHLTELLDGLMIVSTYFMLLPVFI